MTYRRDGRYVWVGWLAKLMVGDIACEWAPWFRTNFQGYAKQPSDFDEVNWRMNHARALRELCAEREGLGERCTLERQNEFRYRRPEAGLVLAGKPDLVTTKANDPCVFDVKTGQVRAADGLQVLIYMHCLRECFPEFRRMNIRGEVAYTDHRVDVPGSALDAAFGEKLSYFLDILDSDEPARKAPSASECRYCDITLSDCPERIDELTPDSDTGGRPSLLDRL